MERAKVVNPFVISQDQSAAMTAQQLPWYLLAVQNQGDQFTALQCQPQRKFSWTQAFGNLLKGGIGDTLKGIFTLPGMALTALTGGALWLTGGAILPYLAGLGIAIGGLQVVKGLGSAFAYRREGDVQAAEQSFRGVGSGLATGILSLLGFRAAQGAAGTSSFAQMGQTAVAQTAAAKSKLGAWLKSPLQAVQQWSPKALMNRMILARVQQRLGGLLGDAKPWIAANWQNGKLPTYMAAANQGARRTTQEGSDAYISVS